LKSVFPVLVPDMTYGSMEISGGTCLLSDFDHTWRFLAAFCKAAPGV